MKRQTLIAVLIVAFGAMLCFIMFRNEPKAMPKAAGIRLAKRLMASAKTYSSIRNWAGKVNVYEWRRFPSGGSSERSANYNVSFQGDRYKLSEHDNYNRHIPAGGSIIGRLSRFRTRLTNPNYSNWSCCNDILAYDGHSMIKYVPADRKAFVLAGGPREFFHLDIRYSMMMNTLHSTGYHTSRQAWSARAALDVFRAIRNR